MNTLPRAITAQIFPNPETYHALRKHWSALVNSERKHELTAAHHLLYLALLGKDWRKAFTPITNPRKLANGAFHECGLFRALYHLHHQSIADLRDYFDGLVTFEMIEQVRNFLPRVNSYQYRPEEFSSGQFPFHAYSVPTDLLSVSLSVSNEELTHA